MHEKAISAFDYALSYKQLIHHSCPIPLKLPQFVDLNIPYDHLIQVCDASLLTIRVLFDILLRQSQSDRDMRSL